MPFFFMLPLWLVCVLLGITFLFFPRLRFLSAHILLGSTIGLLVSFGLSTLALILLPKTAVSGWIVLVGYLAGIAIGGAIGIAIGVLAAKKLNNLVASRKPSN